LEKITLCSNLHSLTAAKLKGFTVKLESSKLLDTAITSMTEANI